MRFCTRWLAWNGPVAILLGLLLALVAGLLLVKLTPLGGVLFVLLAVGGMVTLIEPLWGLAVTLFVSILYAYLSAWVPQVDRQIGQVFVALTLTSWLARGLARREIRIPLSPLLLALLLFASAALVSLGDAVELPTYGLPEMIKWVQVVLLFLFVSTYLTRQRVSSLLGVLLAIGLFQALLGLYQFALRGDRVDPIAILSGHFAGWQPSAIQEAWTTRIGTFAISAGRFYRAYGTFEQPNPYAGFLGLMLPLAVGVVVGVVWERGRRGEGETRGQGDKGTRRRGDEEASSFSLSPPHLVSLSLYLRVLLAPKVLISTGIAMAMGLALVASWSRGAWIGFGAAVVAMTFALPRKTRWGLLLVAALAVGGIGLYASGLMPASLEARLTDFTQYVQFEDVRGVGINDANFSVIERQAHWQAALEMWRYNFWNGVGFGCYEPAYRDFALINWPIALGHAHNYYLNIAAETGLIGLLAYLLLWGAVFWQTWRAIRQSNGLFRGLAIGLLGTWTHLSVHHLFDNLYVNNVHLYIGVLLGILAYVANGRMGE